MSPGSTSGATVVTATGEGWVRATGFLSPSNRAALMAQVVGGRLSPAGPAAWSERSSCRRSSSRTRPREAGCRAGPIGWRRSGQSGCGCRHVVAATFAAIRWLRASGPAGLVGSRFTATGALRAGWSAGFPVGGQARGRPFCSRLHPSRRHPGPAPRLGPALRPGGLSRGDVLQDLFAHALRQFFQHAFGYSTFQHAAGRGFLCRRAGWRRRPARSVHVGDSRPLAMRLPTRGKPISDTALPSAGAPPATLPPAN